MSDKILIKGLSFFAKHGVFVEERILGQKFVITLILEVNLQETGRKDDIVLGICYKNVIETVLDFCTKKTFKTLEGLSEHLAYKLLISFERLISVDITIEKPSAAISASFDYVAVNIKRDRVTMTMEQHKKISVMEHDVEYA